jgi:hypothetical protein
VSAPSSKSRASTLIYAYESGLITPG